MTSTVTWHVPPKGLGEEGLAAAQHVVARCQAEEELGLAVVSGSLVMGLGHAISDLDLYLARTDGTPVRGQGAIVNGFCVHVNPLTKQKVRELAGYGDSFRVSSSDRAQLSLGPADNKLLLRLVNGTVLLADDHFRALLDSIDLDVVRQLVILRHACHAVELQEDVYGALASSDPMTAATASHRALLHALEAGLGGVGEVYDHEKVVLRRLARHGGTEHLLAQVWELLNGEIPFGAPLERVAEVSRLRSLMASHLIGTAVLAGWTTPTTQVPPFQVCTGGPLRSPDFNLLRFTDGIALTGRDYGSRVSEAMARLWLSLDGGPISQIVRSPLLKGSGADLEKIRTAVGRLADVGAVENYETTRGGVQHD